MPLLLVGTLTHARSTCQHSYSGRSTNSSASATGDHRQDPVGDVPTPAELVAWLPVGAIYLQSIDGYSPLGAGLRFLPITAFIFLVPLITRKHAASVPLWLLLSGSLGLVALGLLLMETVSQRSHWTALLPGLIVAGIGIGLANPTIAGAALRVVDPARTGMASGISNTCRVGGLALGVAALGVSLQQRVGDHLAAAGYGGKTIAAAVSSAGLRTASGRPALVPIANAAFVSGFRLILLIACLTLLLGALAAVLLVRPKAKADTAAPVSAS